MGDVSVANSLCMYIDRANSESHHDQFVKPPDIMVQGMQTAVSIEVERLKRSSDIKPVLKETPD